MSRRFAPALAALAAAPLVMLIVLELIALVLMIGVLSDPFDCFSEAPAATLAIVWLAFGPLLAVAAGVAVALTLSAICAMTLLAEDQQTGEARG